jgi:hypothetical protein
MPTKRPDSEHLEPLTGRQVLAVAAMLKHGAVPAAAAEVGVSERQVRRWAVLPAFKRALRAERRAMMDGLTSRLAAGASEAEAALREIVNDKKQSAAQRVSAAKILLDNALKTASEADVAARLERIERLAEGRAPSEQDDDEPEPGRAQRGAEQLQ